MLSGHRDLEQDQLSFSIFLGFSVFTFGISVGLVNTTHKVV